MKPLALVFLALCLGFTNANAQAAMDKFISEICSCFEKMKPETMTSAAIDEALAKCIDTSIAANKKELKKRDIIDWDKGATEEQVTDMWQLVFKKCDQAAKAAFGRQEALEEEEAAKSFQGTITYGMDIELSGAFKKMGMTKAMMLDELNKDGSWSDSVRVYYRLGNYASFGNSKKATTKIYDASDNIIYSFKAEDDLCSVQEGVDLDFSGNPDKPTVLELDTVATIMGMPCKAIRMKWKLSQFDYYYNATQAQVNPDLFSNHSSEGFAEFVKMTKCLPLQIVKSSMGMMVIQTAAKVRPGKVDEEVFAIPELVEDESLNAIKLPGITIMRIKQ